jgi:alpha-tubulin suppressor-like RCC1 family protein
MRVAPVVWFAVACGSTSAPPPPAPTPPRDGPGAGAAQIAISEGNVCARMVDRTVRCWGDGAAIGDGARSERHTPVVVPGISDAVDVWMGLAQGCARRRDRSVVCWGSSSFLRFGDGNGDAPTPTTVRELDHADEIWLSDDGDGCARWPNGATKCWGGGGGALAAGERSGTFPKATIALLEDATAFSLEESLGCARMRDSTVLCWGRNDVGQVGDGTTVLRLAPVPVQGLRDVVQVAVNRESACARLDDGTVWCWGGNHAGQLGDGGGSDRTQPVRVAGVDEVVELSAGDLHTCARHRDGTLTCWGWNRHGQCGVGEPSEIAKPGRVVGLDRVIQVAVTNTHSCALRDDGAVYCWGQGWRGVIGDGMQIDRSAPVPVAWSDTPRPASPLPSGSRVTAVAVGPSHTCASLDDGSARCWGDNSVGQVTGKGKRDDEPEPIVVPTAVPGVARVTRWSLDIFRSVARLDDGRVVGWGPRRAVEERPVAQNDDYAESFSIACLRRGDTVKCRDRDDRHHPSIAKVTQFDLEHAHACAVLHDGTVACAGSNGSGQLGDGTRADERWTFAVVPGLRDVAQVVTGSQHTCARRVDGTVACWGEYLAIGTGAQDSQRSPVEVAGLADVVDVVAGGSATCARTAAGAVSCWGHYGHMVRDDSFSAKPIVVPWLAGASQIALGTDHSCAILADGTLGCWGDNQFGQLGDGTMARRAEATPVSW